jgi:AraC-like DNA-binding protein
MLLKAVRPWLKANSLGRCYRVLEGKRPTSELESWQHEESRLIIGLTGKGRFLTVEDGRDTIYEMNRGDSLFLAPNTWICPIPEQSYSSVAFRCGNNFLKLAITRRTLKRNELKLEYLAELTLVQPRRLADDFVLQLLQESDPGSIGDCYVRYLTEIFIHRCWDIIVEGKPADRQEGHHAWKAASDFMFDHWSEPSMSRDRVADHIDVHPNHLSRIFRRYGKVHFNSFLSEIRLTRSVQMLEESSYTITDIAALCGYTDLQYFIRCFRSRFGTTPGKFRTRRQAQRQRSTAPAKRPLAMS